MTPAWSPEGRKLLRLEVRNAQTPIERKPPWIKTRARMGPEYTELKDLVRREGLHTVCEEAGCPNIFECWEDREATFLIGGEQCTRRCDFCQIDTGKPAELDRDEPRRVAESVAAMGLRYSTVTGVARDDLPDGGAWLYAETVRYIRKLNPEHRCGIADTGLQRRARAARAGLRVTARSVGAQRRNRAAHLQADPTGVPLRPQPRVLTAARDYGLVTKSNLILGMGETPDEVRTALTDLCQAGCDIVTITQYLRPSVRHHPVERWVTPEEFVEHAQFAEGLGFRRRAGRAAGAVVVPGGPAVHPGRAIAASRILSSWPKPANPPPNKAAKAEAKAARKAASKQRRSQLWQAFQMQRKEDKRLLPYMIGAFVLIVAAAVAAGILIGGFTMFMLIPLGIVLGALVAFIIFGRRAQKSVYRKAEGQTGAAAWALDNLRGKWRVTPGVAATGHFDAVHRVIGRPGVIFVAEGSPARVKPLLAQEKKRTARLVGDIPIYDIVVGNGEGEVPLAKLERHLTKLPANITVKQMDSLESRLAALGTKVGPAAMPKGPMPAQAKMRGVQRTVRRK